jgi:hypothetical protein
MLDNDMIRMDQKINTILELRDIDQEKKLNTHIKKEDIIDGLPK